MLSSRGHSQALSVPRPCPAGLARPGLRPAPEFFQIFSGPEYGGVGRVGGHAPFLVLSSPQEQPEGRLQEARVVGVKCHRPPPPVLPGRRSSSPPSPHHRPPLLTCTKPQRGWSAQCSSSEGQQQPRRSTKSRRSISARGTSALGGELSGEQSPGQAGAARAPSPARTRTRSRPGWAGTPRTLGHPHKPRPPLHSSLHIR